jgi:hypothetical protein
MWSNRWELPQPTSKEVEYEERVKKFNKIKDRTKEIMEGIEKLNGEIEADRKYWRGNDPLRFLLNIRSENLRKRYQKYNLVDPDQDPVVRYRQQI